MDTAARTDLAFRLASAEDIPQLAEMVNAAFTVEAFMEGTRTSAAELAEELAKGSILIAEDNSGRLCGSVYIEPRGTCGYLGMLAVAPAAQHMGLARHITEEAFARLRAAGCKLAEIVVLSLRTELLSLYRRWGFVETGPVDFNPGRGVKPGFEVYGIRMEKPLD